MTPQPHMYAFSDTFGHPERAITTLETALWTVDRDDPRLVAEKFPNDRFTQVPLFCDLLNCVVNLKSTHSIALVKSVRTAVAALVYRFPPAIFFRQTNSHSPTALTDSWRVPFRLHFLKALRRTAIQQEHDNQAP